MFKFEERTCVCGEKFDALDFWDVDARCGDCAMRGYNERLAAINAEKPYRIDSIGGAMPTQAEGEWPDGQKFYFRARHGEWWLYLDPDDPIGKWDADARGDDPSHGCMDNADVLAILDAHLAATTDPRRTDAATTNGAHDA